MKLIFIVKSILLSKVSASLTFYSKPMSEIVYLAA